MITLMKSKRVGEISELMEMMKLMKLLHFMNLVNLLRCQFRTDFVPASYHHRSHDQ